MFHSLNPSGMSSITSASVVVPDDTMIRSVHAAVWLDGTTSSTSSSNALELASIVKLNGVGSSTGLEVTLWICTNDVLSFVNVQSSTWNGNKTASLSLRSRGVSLSHNPMSF